MRQVVEEEAAALDTLIDDYIETRRAAGRRIFCGAGCSSCCTLYVQATMMEAVIVAEGLETSQIQSLQEYVQRQQSALAGETDLLTILRKQRTQIGPCPFLDKSGQCSIYHQRPLACRALLSTKDPAWCGVDFSTLAPLEKRLYLVSLEREHVAYPMHYLAQPQDAARSAEERILEEMRSNFNLAISGNFPLLVYLAARTSLRDAEGCHWSSILLKSDFYHPHLIHIE